MNIKKFLLRFFGNSLLNLSLTFFIFSFFAIYSLDNIDIFENSLKNVVDKDFVLRDFNETQKQQLEEFCEVNPSYEGCDLINNPESSMENVEFRNFIDKIQGYKNIIINIRILSIILFFVGILLIYLSNLNLILTLYKISLSSFITAALAVLYYKFLPNILVGIFNSDAIKNKVREIPNDIFSRLIDAILEWLKTPANQTLKLSLIITIIFLTLTIIFYISKRKVLNKNA